jgi:hypothetical protein
MAVYELANEVQPRSLSRSSIASTHVSDRGTSPPRANFVPQSVSGLPAASERLKSIDVKPNASLNTDMQMDSLCPPKVEGSISSDTLNHSGVGSGTATSALSSVCLASPDTLKNQILPAGINVDGSKPQTTLPSPQSRALQWGNINICLRHLLGMLSTSHEPTLAQVNGKFYLTNGSADDVKSLEAPNLPAYSFAGAVHFNKPSAIHELHISSPPSSSVKGTESIAVKPQLIKSNFSSTMAGPITPDTIQTAQLPAPIVRPPPSPRAKPSEPLIDRDTLHEHIAKSSSTKSTAEALRVVVMTRLLCDRQTREELVDPVLLANQAVAAESHDGGPSFTVHEIIAEVTEGKRHDKRMETFAAVKGSLIERFKERQDFLTEKTQRLREQYVSLHERWVAHCASLDEETKPVTQPEPEPVQQQPPGRTTRRSTANLGDAVRSDLEMEQIIASLGIDEATDPNQLSLRNLAIVPDMISVTHGKVDYVYDDTNHLIENPSGYYGPHTGINDWTEEEKAIFQDKFAAHPKQFGLIAEYIVNKTAAQCVDYYYLHKKKFIDFRKIISLYAPNKRRRRGMGKKKGNGLLADIRQHDAEVHRDSGSPSVGGRAARGSRRNMPPPEPRKTAISRRSTVQLEGTPTSTPTPEPDARPRRRRAAAVAPMSAPLSRTVSVSVDEAEEETVSRHISSSFSFALNLPFH